MRPVVMIPGQEGFDFGEQAREVIGPIRPQPKHSLRNVRLAFNIGLLVLLVRASEEVRLGKAVSGMLARGFCDGTR